MSFVAPLVLESNTRIRVSINRSHSFHRRLNIVVRVKSILSTMHDEQRMQLLQETLNEFRNLYSNDKALTEALTPELTNADFKQRVELAAWTMMTHSLLNLELAKVKR